MDLTQIDISKFIELGGTVIVVIFFIISNSLKDKQFIKIIENHIFHSTEATKKLTIVIEKLIEKLN